MDISLRTISLEEYEPWVRATARAFGSVMTPEELERWRLGFEPSRALAAFDGDRIVGTAGSFVADLTVPGGTAPMTAVTAVGVAPTHRRRGILRSLMRRQLDAAHEQGEPVAGLWASESSIYGRFGYGMAARGLHIRLDRDRAGLLDRGPAEGTVTLVEREKALSVLAEVYERVHRRAPGMLAMTDDRWQQDLADPEHDRDGASPLFFAVREADGRADGVVAYRMKQDWSHGFPDGELRIRQMFAEDDAAYRDLWRYCLGVDLVKTVEAWDSRIDEPLVHMLAEPRRLRGRVHDSLWVRLVDVPVALEARRSATEGSVVLEVHDPFCPWNDGGYAVALAPDGASCRRTDAGADVTVDVAALGAAYLGDASFRALRTAGRAAGDDEAIARADALFGWPVAPWCPIVF